MSVNIYDASSKKLIPISGNGANLQYRGDWISNYPYKKNSVVKHNDMLWIALTDNSSEPTSENITNWKFYILEPKEVKKSNNNGSVNIDGSDIRVYTHPNSAGYNHIPIGGMIGQVLGYSAEGVASWNNTCRNLVSAKVYNEGNTIQYNYSDGRYEILEILSDDKYHLTSYTSEGTKIETIITDVDTDGNVTITRS